MNNDMYIYVITALLPLSACMLVFQVNPYHALVIRGILGAVAAMLYAVLGAADVALTEALMGTMLAITLYAIAVRSSLVMRLGVLEDEAKEGAEGDRYFGQLMNDFRTIFGKRYMRLELVPYTNTQALHRALMEKEVHATCAPGEGSDQNGTVHGDEKQLYHTVTRVKRIYDIMQAELWSPETALAYVIPTGIDATDLTTKATSVTDLEEQHT
jgi:putative multicomponent Na+:H+ antiporter subunit B